MAQQVKPTPSFFRSSLKKVNHSTFVEKAMRAFLDLNFEQFKINLAAAKNAGENFNALCSNGETLATILAKFPNANYMNVATSYNIDWSAKNQYGETAKFIKECHEVGNDPNKTHYVTTLEPFLAELKKSNLEQTTVARALKAVDAVNNFKVAKKEADKAIEQALTKVEIARSAVTSALDREKTEAAKEEIMKNGAFLQEILQNIEKLQDSEVNQALHEYVNVLKSKSEDEVVANAEENLIVALHKAGAEDILNSIIKHRDYQLEKEADLIDVIKSISDPEVVEALKKYEDAEQSFSSQEGEDLEEALDNAIENLLSKVASHNPELGAIIKQFTSNYFGHTNLEKVINSAVAREAAEAAAREAAAKEAAAKEAAENVIHNTKAKVADVVEVVADKIENAAAAVAGKADDVKQSAQDFAAQKREETSANEPASKLGIIDTFRKAFVEEKAGNVKQSAQEVTEQKREDAKEVGNKLADGAEKAKESVKDAAADLKEGAKEVGNELADGAKEVKESVKNTAEDLKEGAKEVAKEVGNELADDAEKVVEQGSNVLEDLITTSDNTTSDLPVAGGDTSDSSSDALAAKTPDFMNNMV